MSAPPSSDDDPKGWDGTARVVWLANAALAGLLVAMVVLGGASGAAVATNHTNNSSNLSDTAPYYPNQTGNVSPVDEWLPAPNASIDAVGDLLVRIGPAVIGTGDRDRSGTGYIGVLLTGLMFAGGATLAVAGTGLGPIGGVVVGLTMAYAMPALGLAPGWLQPIILFVVAAIAGLAVLRAVNS